MTATKHHVTIKGVKDGLVFVLDDTCRLTDLLEELQHKLEKTHHKILSGPLIRVYVKLGKRVINEAEQEQIRELIGQHGNLIIQSFETSASPALPPEILPSGIKVITGIVRSGQTVTHEGNVMLLGDVNPGGSILSTGDIFVMGSLRGMAHAGTQGDEKAIIAASYMRPTQLRIAGIFSRPPDEWGIDEALMEFAYIQNARMEIDKIYHIQRIRPDLGKG
ncbi:Septum site-determining protein MinC [Chlamydia abortus]|jgi:septum site-determining protein MinC|uniref:septum site-determining protein MinC n=1 Tax=Paenibacillus sp. SAFN-117 TaxID=3436860 RepID=UPI000A27E6D9|nr:septum site-determining protein MinC [Aneurinibacillus sp. XH2]SHE09847.1 Septum site-determining protein MinC [Chlamydia abortus]